MHDTVMPHAVVDAPATQHVPAPERSRRKNTAPVAATPAPAALVAPPLGGPAALDLPSAQVISEDLIRQRAYELFIIRAELGAGGDAYSDWMQAERELRGLAYFNG